MLKKLALIGSEMDYKISQMKIVLLFSPWSEVGLLSTQAWMPAYASILRSTRQKPRSLQKFLLSLSGLAGA
jgi:hypothetical protein